MKHLSPAQTIPCFPHPHPQLQMFLLGHRKDTGPWLCCHVAVPYRRGDHQGRLLGDTIRCRPAPHYTPETKSECPLLPPLQHTHASEWAQAADLARPLQRVLTQGQGEGAEPWARQGHRSHRCSGSATPRRQEHRKQRTPFFFWGNGGDSPV